MDIKNTQQKEKGKERREEKKNEIEKYQKDNQLD